VSDRNLAAPDEAAKAWMRQVEERLGRVESRRLQGALSMEEATIGKLAIGASSTDPMRLNGSAKWTQAVEYLGETGGRVVGVSGSDALVTRNENGVIMDMSPRQVASLNNATAQSINAATATVITWAGATNASSPFPSSKAAASVGHLIFPVAGVYDVFVYALWQALGDTTVRLITIESSGNGGASWGSLFTTDMGNNGHAGFGQLQSMRVQWPFQANDRIRLNVDQRSAGALAITPITFSATFVRGPMT